MKISGVMPLRNAVRLGYPFEQAIASMRPLCDEIVVLVDPTSDDDTLERVRATSPDVIVESPWDMANHQGHTNCEISVQTAKVCAQAHGDWILSLQADELLHEAEVEALRAAVSTAERQGVTGIELRRLYFYGSLDCLREDWTLWLLRLFKRGRWQPDIDGAMRFDPCHAGEKRSRLAEAHLYHYSRVGDRRLIAERVRNLDRFFHSPAQVQAGELAPYDFSTLRQLDTYVLGHVPEAAEQGRLSAFPRDAHPVLALQHFGGNR